MLFVLKQKYFFKPEQMEDNSYNLAMGQSKFSYELTFWFILIKNIGKQKVMVNAIPLEVLMPSTKWEGLSYPTHF